MVDDEWSMVDSDELLVVSYVAVLIIVKQLLVEFN